MLRSSRGDEISSTLKNKDSLIRRERIMLIIQRFQKISLFLPRQGEGS